MDHRKTMLPRLLKKYQRKGDSESLQSRLWVKSHQKYLRQLLGKIVK
jgi:hypothetical protein